LPEANRNDYGIPMMKSANEAVILHAGHISQTLEMDHLRNSLR
jgi:hypothetical protein